MREINFRGCITKVCKKVFNEQVRLSLSFSSLKKNFHRRTGIAKVF